jgi:hypothetical protein
MIFLVKNTKALVVTNDFRILVCNEITNIADLSLYMLVLVA